MRQNFCVACGEANPAKLEHHHLVPVAVGGSDDETNLITLCDTCHGKVHGYARTTSRGFSLAAWADPEKSARMRAAAVKRSRRARQASDRHWREVAAPALEIEFHAVRPTARQVAEALNRVGIKTWHGGRWFPQTARREAGRAGYVLAQRDDGYGAWAEGLRALAAGIVESRVVSYAAAAVHLEAARARPYGAEGWSAAAARRLLSALGLRLSGHAPAALQQAAGPLVPVASGSRHTAHEYGRYWRGFLRWRGTGDGLPVTDLELAAFLEQRLAAASLSTARHFLSGVSHVHVMLGYDRLSLRPVAREFMRRKKATVSM